MKLAIIILLVACTAHADAWYKVHVENGKAVSLSYREKAGKHVLGPNEFPKDAVLPKHVDCKYWKKQGQTWVEMSQAEKDAVDDADKAEAADFSKWDAELEALVLVVCEELQISKNEMDDKLKSKIKKDKIKPKK